MQFMSGLSLLIGLLSFPAGWDNDEVRGVCGPKADDYQLGSCGVRWAFALAVIALFDTIILGKSDFSPHPVQSSQLFCRLPGLHPGYQEDEGDAGGAGLHEPLHVSWRDQPGLHGRQSLHRGLQEVWRTPARHADASWTCP